MLARRILRGLQRSCGGDGLSVAQSLRLVGSRNSKPHRQQALCRVVDACHATYHAPDFAHLLPIPPPARQRHVPHRSSTAGGRRLNPALIQAVSLRLTQMGYIERGDWLNGPCLYPTHHQHDDSHPSFGFNIRSGYGNCFVCGSILLKDICSQLGFNPADYGGLFVS